MTVSEFQDMVRRKLGVPDLDPTDLQLFAVWGRYELESRGNYYYGIALKDHTLTASTQSYSLTSSSGTGLGITAYKEHRELFIRDASGQIWLPVPIGSWDTTLPDHAHSTTGKPQAATIENETLYLFPSPDAAYNIRLVHFNWTTNPADITSTDELFTRWSQAIFYSTMMVAKRFQTQNPQAGKEWEDMMTAQIKQLKEFTNRRLSSSINSMSVREAATVLQASGGQPQ